MMSMAIVMAGNDVRAHDDVSALETGGAGYFYVGLDYSPAFSKIRDFSIRESNGETKAVYPYLKDGKSVKLESHKFDWNTPDPRIGFKDNMLVAMEGSVGYGIGGARVELEIGYERFKTKGIRDSGSKEDEADTVYLLAKELAYDVVTGQTDKLTAALAKTSGKDIVQFANAVKISSSAIDGKVCTGSHADLAPGTNAGKKFVVNPEASGSTDGDTSQCSGLGHSSGVTQNPKLFSTFVDTVKIAEDKNWPTGRAKSNTSLKTGDTNSNAKAVATDLVQELTPEEKTIVAGLLAKTIEGGEVVEIRAVSSTSVMVNACYDLLSEGLGVVPYACVGLGGNFVGVVDGHITPKLAYRLKAGLSYQLSPVISAFAGGFYHRVVGDGVYDDLPAQRLVDDTSPAGRTKDTAIANFSMAYVGGEFGVRFAF
ncbi:P44/Msp2 family outer membrane protein [Anaplasma phagocytophilum]|uniref:Surface antigen family protein n=2 Tax=Anaplasma phagocytophilum TaxID=948 RepID=A0A0F3MUH4_ANAPH|nr:P44/Msp2 family outer membrane protein [Anaplasma phagocytophilum]ABD44306.1 P44-2b outer membrane protein [Anaplasma phagocytophilum str. HZ]AGR79695.1 p44 outer membrane protein [Anaplasma phagocytophilum str. HZ2]KJV59331.1 surface antigen family protein [Anaplasma phagocytophilum str. NCH-1]KJV59453.1 surface antigen family protein [Anaplasma phagocytophilum str. NCH-1]KJV87217.1 surface antigen family protein [Anaplasma phagocytophilum str. ApNYW]